MLALVCTAVFVVAAAFAIIAIMVTMQGRKAQIAALLAEYRSLRRDREFLVQITSHGAPAVPGVSASPNRRRLRRIGRSIAEATVASQPLRAAA
ncbi:MAG: hypothetical protein NTX28_01235 [Novosphingobium sp.]|nr:hypothetical protein [Novosphingobium sp.]